MTSRNVTGVDTDNNDTDLTINRKGLIESSLSSHSNFSLSKTGKLELRISKGLRYVRVPRRGAPDLRSRLFSVPAVGKGYGNCVPPWRTVIPKEKGYYWWVAQAVHYGVRIKADKEGMMEEIREVMRQEMFRVPRELLDLERGLRKRRKERTEEKEAERRGTEKRRRYRNRLMRRVEGDEDEEQDEGVNDEIDDHEENADIDRDEVTMITDTDDRGASRYLVFDGDRERVNANKTSSGKVISDEEAELANVPDGVRGEASGDDNEDRVDLDDVAHAGKALMSPRTHLSAVTREKGSDSTLTSRNVHTPVRTTTKTRPPNQKAITRGLEARRQAENSERKKRKKQEQRQQRLLTPRKKGRKRSKAKRNEGNRVAPGDLVQHTESTIYQNTRSSAQKRHALASCKELSRSNATPLGVLTRFRSMTVSSHDEEIEPHPEEGRNDPIDQVSYSHGDRHSTLVTPAKSLQNAAVTDTHSPSRNGRHEVSPIFCTSPTGLKRRRESDESVIHIESRPVKRVMRALSTASDEVIELSSDEETASENEESESESESEPEDKDSGSDGTKGGNKSQEDDTNHHASDGAP